MCALDAYPTPFTFYVVIDRLSCLLHRQQVQTFVQTNSYKSSESVCIEVHAILKVYLTVCREIISIPFKY